MTELEYYEALNKRFETFKETYGFPTDYNKSSGMLILPFLVDPDDEVEFQGDDECPINPTET